LATTLIHRVLGRFRGLILFILLTNTFLISCLSAFHACPNHSSRFLLRKKSMSGLLFSCFIFSFLHFSYSCISELKIGPYMVRNTFLSNVISLLLSPQWPCFTSVCYYRLKVRRLKMNYKLLNIKIFLGIIMYTKKKCFILT